MELARQYYPGDADMRESLANLGEIGPEDVEPEFYKAAFGAAEGQVTRPVNQGARPLYSTRQVSGQDENHSCSEAAARR